MPLLRGMYLALLFCVGVGCLAALRTMEAGFKPAAFYGSLLISVVLFGSLAMPAFRSEAFQVGLRRSILLACFIAMTAESWACAEERWFVFQHASTGSGPSPRWFFHHHWLQYDPVTRRLTGGD